MLLFPQYWCKNINKWCENNTGVNILYIMHIYHLSHHILVLKYTYNSCSYMTTQTNQLPPLWSMRTLTLKGTKFRNIFNLKPKLDRWAHQVNLTKIWLKVGCCSASFNGCMHHPREERKKKWIYETTNNNDINHLKSALLKYFYFTTKFLTLYT